MATVKLSITLKKSGTVNSPYLKIGRWPIALDNGTATFNATSGNVYWLYWQIEGNAGAGVEITIATADGTKKLELSKDATEIPPQIRRNAGTKKFVA